MARLAQVLFAIARSRAGGYFISWSFAHMSFIIPVDRLYETERVVAFHHPKPGYQTHILIVPKQNIPGILALTEAETSIVGDVILATQHLVKELNLEPGGFSLLVNGGAYQDVQQVHWHLISGDNQPA
jgi:histidine triad (HIT) family protein